MNEFEMVCQTLRPIHYTVGIILLVVTIFNRFIVQGSEKRVMQRLDGHEGWLTRHNRELTSLDNRMDNTDKSTYEIFTTVRVIEERDKAHRELCDERHKEREK